MHLTQKRLLVGTVVVVVLIASWWMWNARTLSPVSPASSAGQTLAPQAPTDSPTQPVATSSANPSPSALKDERVLVRGGWGTGPGQFGRKAEGESNPEGPMSLAMDDKGNSYVLDTLNGRLQRFDNQGRPLDSIRLTQRTPQDVSVASNGSVAVLDRLGDKSVALYSPNGGLLGEVSILGKNVEDPGAVSGVFMNAQGVFVERDHATLVRIADASGKPDATQPVVDGRMTRDGKMLISAAIMDGSSGTFWVRGINAATSNLLFQKKLTVPVPILELNLLDSDSSGRVYVGAHVAREVEPGKFTDEGTTVVCLSTAGELQGQVSLPVNTLADESFKDYSVAPDGTIVFMQRTQSGVQIIAYRCG